MQRQKLGAQFTVLFPQKLHIRLTRGRFHPVGGSLEINDISDLVQLEMQRFQMLNKTENLFLLGGKFKLRAAFLRNQQPDGDIVPDGINAETVFLRQRSDSHRQPSFSLPV